LNEGTTICYMRYYNRLQNLSHFGLSVTY